MPHSALLTSRATQAQHCKPVVCLQVAKQLKLGERTANASGRGFKASGDFVILSKQLKDITITPDGTRWAEKQLRESGRVTGFLDSAPSSLYWQDTTC